MAEKLLYGFEVTLIGFTGVILILYFLYLILLSFGNFIARAEKKPPKTPTPSSALTSADANSTQNNIAAEVVAAITTAISISADLPPERFKIVAIQPEKNFSGWILAGRQRIMAQRQNMAISRREKRS